MSKRASAEGLMMELEVLQQAGDRSAAQSATKLHSTHCLLGGAS
jgi:hypothetical protein